MRLKTLVAAAVAAAFVVPLLTQAQSEKAPSGPSAGATAPQSGDEKFKSLDKNKDGYISRDEAKDTPYERVFSQLDKDSDGKLSPSEHAAAPAAGSGAGAGATGSPAPSDTAPKKQ
jgi:hypothetical protein